jgi:sugar O-acyltransferase (sialic acid O-acetyltransferase NeuD family)
MSQPVILVAASGLAREVITMLEASSTYRVRCIVDDEPSLHGTAVGGVLVLGPLEVINDHPGAHLLICAGRGAVRALIRDRLAAMGVADVRFATVIDPSVRVPSSCSIGAGSIVLAQTVLTADVQVGRHVVIMPHVTLTHDDRLEDYVTVCAGVALGGSVQVGHAAYLGMNSSVRENVSVGEAALLGMGAVLLRDLPAGETWAGAPAARISSAAVPNSLVHHVRSEGVSA